MSKSLFQRRFPTYLGGLLLGLAFFIVMMQVKRAMAPTFVETKDTRPFTVLAPGGSIRMTYAEEPGYLLVYGFPSQLAVGKQDGQGKVQPLFRLQYRELTEKEILIGPFPDQGVYELRAVFHVCEKPGDAVCVRHTVDQRIDVTTGDQPFPKEAPWRVDLRQMLKDGLSSEAGEAARKGAGTGK